MSERPSAEEREALVRRLREHCADERLSLDTFSYRIERVYTARSRAELEELAADLPARESRIGRALSAGAARLSELTTRLGSAWREPRVEHLTLPVRQAVTLGRSSDCDCVLTDPTVSRTHACLRYINGTWLLRDLRSTNGTRLNGWRVVEEVEVRVGDQVTFGAATYRLAPPREHVTASG
jgi:hypothetical protein